MLEAQRVLRDRLTTAGLDRSADLLIELAAPSIRLRPEGPAESVSPVTRPPAEVRGFPGAVVAIAGSGYHNLVVTENQTVMAWGDNRFGQLGDGTRSDRRSPVAVGGLAGVIAVAAGKSHSLALCSDGSVFAWGDNRGRQLGDGSSEPRHEPVRVRGLDEGVSAIVAGDENSVALRADGAVVGWGLSVADKLGYDYAPDRPVQIPGLEAGIVAIAAGTYHRLALTAAGTVLAWGLKGTAGMGEPGPSAAQVAGPRTVDGLEDVSAIAAGSGHSLALRRDGSVLAWGENFFGQLGARREREGFDPVRVDDLGAPVCAIAVGNNCSYAIREDGSAWSWGWNYQGQLGDGTTNDRNTPTPIPTLRDEVIAIDRHLALKADGAVLAWGGEPPAGEDETDARLPLAATKLGGRPDLRPRLCWPEYQGRPLSFVAQINLAELPRLDEGEPLPPAGLLSFFFDHAEPIGTFVSAVVFSEGETPLIRRDFPEELPDSQQYPAAELQAEIELTLPPDPPTFLSEPDWDNYRWTLPDLDARPIHRMLGHPQPVQGDPRDGAASHLLLQIDCDDVGMDSGDLPRLYYLIEPEALQAHTFGAARCNFQSH